MTAPIKIHGYSDDLIIIEGEITDEIPANHGEPTTFKIGPWGFKAKYDGEWRIRVTDSAVGQSFTKWPAGNHPDCKGYTEVVEISGHPEYGVRRDE